MKKSFFISLFFILFVSITGVQAQSNDLIDNLLAEKEAKLGETAVLVLAGAGLIDENASESEAIQFLTGRGWGFKDVNAEKTVTAGMISLLIMRSFNIQGGIFYSLFPGERYAFRELAYLGFINREGGPYRKISGEEAIRILQATLDWKEEEK